MVCVVFSFLFFPTCPLSSYLMFCVGVYFFSKFINPGFCPGPVETAHPPFSVSRQIAVLLLQFCNFLQHCPGLLITNSLQ